MAIDRIPYLEGFLQTRPTDEFARYALAMEYARVGRNEEALSAYDQLIQQHPDYPPAYFQGALLLSRLGQVASAIARLREGIAAATRINDAHHRREMQGVLDDLEAASEDA